jgi:hypothetical protein
MAALIVSTGVHLAQKLRAPFEPNAIGVAALVKAASVYQPAKL